MGEPSRIGRAGLLGVGAVGALLMAGCSFVPTSRLDACHTLSQTLQAENSRLKDLALKHRTQNRDLSQRAVDDADRLREQDEAIARLERSVQAYQDERERMASALERIRGQIRASNDPTSPPLLGRLEAFARAHPGCELDSESATISFAVDDLFEPKTDRLRPEALALLDDFAGLLDGPEGAALGLVVVAPAAPPVHRAGLGIDLDGPRARYLSLALAARVRERLADGGCIDASRIALTGGEGIARSEGDPAPSARRVEIRLRRGDEAPDTRTEAAIPPASWSGGGAWNGP